MAYHLSMQTVMISISHPVWRALRLSDAASIDYLNRMFKRGWGMVPFDMDRIAWLMMRVPVETPARTTFNDEHQLVAAAKIPSMFVVVLRQDRRRDVFRAHVWPRDESGRRSMDWSGFDKSEWSPIISLTLETGDGCTIFARWDILRPPSSR